MAYGSLGLCFTIVQFYLDQVKIYLTVNTTSENQAWSALIIKQRIYSDIVDILQLLEKYMTPEWTSTVRQWKAFLSLVDQVDICCLFCSEFTFLLLVHFHLGTHPFLLHSMCSFGGPLTLPTLLIRTISINITVTVQGLAYATVVNETQSCDNKVHMSLPRTTKCLSLPESDTCRKEQSWERVNGVLVALFKLCSKSGLSLDLPSQPIKKLVVDLTELSWGLHCLQSQALSTPIYK